MKLTDCGCGVRPALLDSVLYVTEQVSVFVYEPFKMDSSPLLPLESNMARQPRDLEGNLMLSHPALR